MACISIYPSYRTDERGRKYYNFRSSAVNGIYAEAGGFVEVSPEASLEFAIKETIGYFRSRGLSVSRSDICGQEAKNPYPAPDGIQIKCLDDKTIAAWNQVDGRYDSRICSTGKCRDSKCVSADSGDTTTERCGKGNSFDAGAVIAFTRDCGKGYTAYGGLLNSKCVCDFLPQEQQEKEKPIAVQEYGKDGSGGGAGDLGLGSLMKILPQLLIFMIVITILGVFKK